jgi:alanine dehydrogenase
MPGAVARTSTYALNNATLPFIITLANNGWKKAMQSDLHLQQGLNVWNGHITNQPVAEAMAKDFLSPKEILDSAL